MSEIEEKDIIDDYGWNQSLQRDGYAALEGQDTQYFENSELVIQNNSDIDIDIDIINNPDNPNNKFYEYLDPVTSFVTVAARFPYSLFSATSMLVYDNLFKKINIK